MLLALIAGLLVMAGYGNDPGFLPETMGMIKRYEGFSRLPYVCVRGRQTIGYGHNLDASPITERAAEVILEDDVQTALDEARRSVSNFDDLSPARKAVLVDMAFNLGGEGLRKFRRMIAAIEAEDFNGAADEMVNSRWYHQVGNRSRELVEKMREG